MRSKHERIKGLNIVQQAAAAAQMHSGSRQRPGSNYKTYSDQVNHTTY
jgi:hypothetical protein